MGFWFLSPCLCLLYFLFPAPSISAPPPLPSSLCHPDESSALLQFKNSFSIGDIPPGYHGHIDGPSERLLSWNNGTDCCTWSGVTCDKVTGNVICLDVQSSGIEGIIHSNSSLFYLTHLQRLILSGNNFDSPIPSNFGRLKNLKHLDLSDSNFYGPLPQEIAHLSQLVSLDLSFNALDLNTSSLLSVSTNLSNLKELNLFNANMFSVQPNVFMNLSSSLTHLNLSYCDLQGKFPANFFHRYSNLELLDLSLNGQLSGSVPDDLSYKSSPLRVLVLSESGFSVDMQSLTRNFNSLGTLSLSGCKFVGSSYPALVISNLTKLTSLDLSGMGFGGLIPWFSINLEKLVYLNLAGNNFVGQLPESYTNHSNDQNPFLYDPSNHQLLGHLPLNLTIFDLGHNFLNGTIPSWLYSLPFLICLRLNRNQFTGSIQEFKYVSLYYLNLASNKLQGPIPQSLFQQENLYHLDLSRNNLNSAVRLDQFSKLKNLTNLGLSNYNLSLSSNNNFTFPNLVELELSSCNLSEFPYFLRTLGILHRLDLSCNRIQGSLPKWLGNVGKGYHLSCLNLSHNLLTNVDQLPWKELKILDLRSNLIRGNLPIPAYITHYFSISNNQMSGGIPSLFCSLGYIMVLDFSNNNLNGSIPPCLGNLSRLSVLDLSMNMFHGTIPTTFASLDYIRNIKLCRNYLQGPLPPSLCNCKSLEILDLGNNIINDTFPPWLESLPVLQVLVLRSNKFHGRISSTTKVQSPFQKLRILDLSYNQFSGLLPTQYFKNFLAMMNGHVDKLKYMGEDRYHDSVMVTMKGSEVRLERILNIFTTIDFSENNFDGEIPKSIGNLKGLKGLNLSHNKISGHIPPSLRNLTNLEWLDLSSNKLSGKIPMQLIEITTLEVLNLSQNQLVGAIPRGNQFDSFGKDAFIGNLGLYGFQLSITCDNNRSKQPTPSEGNNLEASNGFDWKFAILLGYGCGLVIGISVGYMLFSDKRLACFIRKVGGKRWMELLKARKKKKKKKKAQSNTRRRNH